MVYILHGWIIKDWQIFLELNEIKRSRHRPLSWLHIDYLSSTSVEEHSFLEIELTIVDPHVMVLVANYTKAELSV